MPGAVSEWCMCLNSKRFGEVVVMCPWQLIRNGLQAFRTQVGSNHTTHINTGHCVACALSIRQHESKHPYMEMYSLPVRYVTHRT